MSSQKDESLKITLYPAIELKVFDYAQIFIMC